MIGSGAATGAGIILGLALTSNPIGWAIIGVAAVGIAGSGLMVGIGVREVLDGNPPPEPKGRPSASEGEDTPDTLDFPDDTFGSPPADIKEVIAAGGSVEDFAVVDTSQIPEFPPDIGAGDPGGSVPGTGDNGSFPV